MKIGIITAEDPFYTEEIIKNLIANQEVEIVCAIFPNGFINKKRIFSTFLIYGVLKFIKTVLKVLINKINGGKIHNIFKKNNIQIFNIKSINDDIFCKKLESLNLDLLISNNCPQRMKGQIINIPKFGIINVHLGLLPKYRGVFPIFHALIREETNIGVTVHIVNEKFDDGDIIIQQKISISNGDDLFLLYEKAFKAVPDLLEKTIHKINNNTLELKKNYKSKASYYSFPSLNEIWIYKKKKKYGFRKM